MLSHSCTSVSFFGVCLLFTTGIEAHDPAQREIRFPDRYVLDYPVADQCCPPIRSTFFEADRTISIVRGRRIRHKPNGGYGLPIVTKVDGQNLLHVGADLGWQQVGEPVFAVANGVVRLSTGPELKARKDKAPRERTQMSWGNLIVIEHRFGDDDYVTTVYGHLGADRLVAAGDIVSAGQQIGTIGRKHPRINGGYDPHVHFGVKEGRNAELGAVLLRLKLNGVPSSLTLAALDEKVIELQLSEGVVSRLNVQLNGRQFDIETRDGKLVAPAALLWQIQRPDFAMVGYAQSTDGWRDPIGFLRAHDAHSNPAPFQLDVRRRR